MTAPSSESRPRVVSIASGRGGTGKSLLAANVGVFLATLGKRVVLIDAAFGAANLHLFVGVTQPEHTLGHVLGRRAVDLVEAVEPTPVPGLQIVVGEGDPLWMANPRSAQLKRLVEQARQLKVDYVLIDCGGGTSSHVLDLFLQADVGVLVAVPEPTSIELCYRFMRAAFVRMVRQGADEEAAQVVVDAMRGANRGIPGPLDIYNQAVDHAPEVAERLREAILSVAPHVVINAVRSKSDMELGRAVASAGRRRLGLPVHYLGHLEYDEAVWVALRRRAPLLVEHPEARVSKCIEKIARRLQASRDTEPTFTDIFAGDSHYDLLEVAPTASFEDIRRANRRVREIYGPDSVVMSGLYTRDRLDELHRRFDESYNVLMDAASRKSYDHKLFPDGIPSSPVIEDKGSLVIERVEVPAADRPPMPEVGPGAEFSGALLRQVREALGIDLREIAERTKVGMGYLQAIEDETFNKLPAPVYVRGFLTEYAKILGLEPQRVLETYLDRYRGARRVPTEVPS